MRPALTLIELLVVCCIIAVLIGLLLIAMGPLNFRAKALKTTQRMDALQNALQAFGKDSGSVTASYQRAVPGFGGTALFEHLGSPATFAPAGGQPWHRCHPATSASDPLVLAFPWGKRRSYDLWTLRGASRTFEIESWYAGAMPFTLPPATGASDAQIAAFRAQWELPEPRLLSDLRTNLSGALIALVGVAASEQEYLTDRSPGQAWNDAWGRPLVVGQAVFQPPEFTLTPDALHRRDRYLGQALTAYQYNRSAYFVIAAAGPSLDPALFASEPVSGTPLTPGEITAVWQQACATCMPTPAEVWSEASFDRPPWTGIKAGKVTTASGIRQAFLTSPTEVK